MRGFKSALKLAGLTTNLNGQVSALRNILESLIPEISIGDLSNQLGKNGARKILEQALAFVDGALDGTDGTDDESEEVVNDVDVESHDPVNTAGYMILFPSDEARTPCCGDDVYDHSLHRNAASCFFSFARISLYLRSEIMSVL